MLNEENRKIGRRNFLKAVAAVPAAGAFAWSAFKVDRPLAAGIIGTGGEGRVLIEQTNTQLMRYVAVCDIFEPNRKKGVASCQKVQPDVAPPAEYDDYRKLLERDDIEAVLIATPLWLHAPMTIDALKAGKHVLCEKTMAYSVQACDEMAAAQKASGKILQIGHQRRYNELYRNAVQMIRSGVIGDVHHIRALWHRNGDWRRAVPQSSFDPTPHGYADLEHLVNWRLYAKHSQGLMTELGSHQVDVANWISGAEPTAVMASGGIQRYKDGRELNDHVYNIFEYPNGLTVTYSSIQSNALDNYYEQVMGTRGTVVLAGEGEAFLFMEGKDAAASKATEVAVSTTAAGGPVMEASASRAADAGSGAAVGSASAGYSSLIPYRNELEGFVYSVRTGEPPLCSAAEGRRAARAVLAANQAMERHQRVAIDTPPQA
ncbi:MAG: Myo-inositol 2-dehydrogenase [Phycisphaerae bacterium]|nr:Myo-inositol 2-dehydrogenase [Phycisphaerae bacterium]